MSYSGKKPIGDAPTQRTLTPAPTYPKGRRFNEGRLWLAAVWALNR